MKTFIKSAFRIQINIRVFFFNPLSANPTKWSNTLIQFVYEYDYTTTCVSVFDHFVKLALKGLIKFRPQLAFNFIKKETLTQVFSCEFCETFKNTFFYRTPPMAASTFPINLPENEFFLKIFKFLKPSIHFNMC